MKKTSAYFLAALMIVGAGCTGRNETAVINFKGKFTEKKWSVKELSPRLPSDWSGFKYLTFDMNSSTTQRFEISVYDRTEPRKLEILPFQGVWVRASIPLVHFQKMNTEGMDLAAIWKTPRTGCWIGFTGVVGPVTSVDSLGISMKLPIGSPVLEVRNIRLTMAAEDTVLTGKPVVDEFGQWIPYDYPEKAKDFGVLKNDWTEEENSIESGNSLMTRYGGFKGTKQKATGYFRTEEINGIWWFVDPEGYLFYSNGSCCIEPGSNLARVKGREYIFTSLPPDAGKRTRENRGRKDLITSFYTWNLLRRFGPDWYTGWKNLTYRRMDNWGINTIGNWSDPELGAGHRKAYVATLRGWGIETGRMGMPDVYAPDYASGVDKAAAAQCSPLKNDPWLLGYFIGNEPAWPGRETELADVILSGDDSPMKEALGKYLSDGDTPERRREFVYDTYSKFLSIVCSAIKKYDPNHLNLGLRFGNPPSPGLITESGKHFDVFSINHYGYSVDHKAIQQIYDLTGLPVIIGEFHFGIPRRGLAPGLAQVRDPEERGVAYRYYVENAASHPAVIGTHWFQWIDQPVSGRSDGENYNIGMVDVTDRPYPEMTEAARETFSRLPDIHSGKEPPVTRMALPQ
jgi:hypothetical protein